MTLLRDLYEWVLGWAGSPYGTWALFCLAFAESSFFPIPPDVLLMALTLGDPSRGFWFAGVTTVGSVLGGLFGYLVGYLGGRPLLDRWVAGDRIRSVRRYFQRYEMWAITIAALTPIPYKVFTLSAGAFAIDVRKFVVASLLGRGGRFFLVGGLLQFFGSPMKEFIDQYFNLLTILFFVLLIGGAYLVRYQARRHAV